MPKRLKLDDEANQMQWSQMMIRNAANTIGGNASHLMFVGVWNLLPGLTGIMIRTDTEAKKNFELSEYQLQSGHQLSGLQQGIYKVCAIGLSARFV